jgi:hypothetical protein
MGSGAFGLVWPMAIFLVLSTLYTHKLVQEAYLEGWLAGRDQLGRGDRHRRGHLEQFGWPGRGHFRISDERQLRGLV